MRVTISMTSKQLLDAHSMTGITVGAVPVQGNRFEIEVDYEVSTRLLEIDADIDTAIATLCGTGIGNA